MKTAYNTVRMIMVSAEISKNEAKRHNISTQRELIEYVLDHDSYPELGDDYRLDKDERAEGKADSSMNSCADVSVYSNNGVKFCYICFTCKEYFNSDDDGDFVEGSDYDGFAKFSDADIAKIEEFLK